MRQVVKSIADRLCDEGLVEYLSDVLANTLVTYDKKYTNTLTLEETSGRLCVAKPTFFLLVLFFLPRTKNQLSGFHSSTAQ